MKKIIVVGSLNVDLTIRAPYFPHAGETLAGSEFMLTCGGKGANQATAAAKLGGNVLMCGCVGKDMFGSMLVEQLSACGADTRFIDLLEGCATGTAMIVVSKGENRIILDAGANAYLTENKIDNVLCEAQAGDIYLTQLENPVSVIGYGLKRAKAAGLLTILNPAPANTEIASYLQYADYVIPNESESDILGGRNALFENGASKIITTLGSKGYEYSNGVSMKRYPCIPIKAVDTTGAGDTFCGGLAAELARGSGIEQAMTFASKAASIACMRKGAAIAIPMRKEVENFCLHNSVDQNE